jgi:phosphoglycerate dehydrogenase-like enzyme
MTDQVATPGQISDRVIKKVLATVAFSEPQMEQLRRAFAPAEIIECSADDGATIESALREVDVAVLAGDLDERHIAAPNLQWIHCDHSGLTKSAKPELFKTNKIVTGSAGRSAAALAQHGFYFALALTFEARQLFRDQDSHVWRGIPGYTEKLGLVGKTLGVVGYGNTGKEMAALGKAFGMKVIVYTRSFVEAPSNVDQFFASERGDTIDVVIEKSDVIMLATQLTDATYHMFSREQFARMKKTAFIVNLARGPVIDEDALVEALSTGEIAGAGLDVFAKEPLPADSALWDQPNVIITPHATPALPDRTQRSINMIIANVENYRKRRPMLNAITEKDVFTPRR